MPILGLPRGFLPPILPSSTHFSKLSPRRTCPIQSLFLLIIVFIKHLSSPAKLSTSSFVFLSFQLTFCILLHAHISNAFNLSTICCFIVHVSQPYNATGHIRVFTNLFFSSVVRPFVTSSLVLLNATIAIPILAFTSSMHDPFSVIITPRY